MVFSGHTKNRIRRDTRLSLLQCLVAFQFSAVETPLTKPSFHIEHIFESILYKIILDF